MSNIDPMAQVRLMQMLLEDGMDRSQAEKIVFAGRIHPSEADVMRAAQATRGAEPAFSLYAMHLRDLDKILASAGPDRAKNLIHFLEHNVLDDGALQTKICQFLRNTATKAEIEAILGHFKTSLNTYAQHPTYYVHYESTKDLVRLVFESPKLQVSDSPRWKGLGINRELVGDVLRLHEMAKTDFTKGLSITYRARELVANTGFQLRSIGTQIGRTARQFCNTAKSNPQAEQAAGAATEVGAAAKPGENWLMEKLRASLGRDPTANEYFDAWMKEGNRPAPEGARQAAHRSIAIPVTAAVAQGFAVNALDLDENPLFRFAHPSATMCAVPFRGFELLTGRKVSAKDISTVMEYGNPAGLMAHTIDSASEQIIGKKIGMTSVYKFAEANHPTAVAIAAPFKAAKALYTSVRKLLG